MRSSRRPCARSRRRASAAHATTASTPTAPATRASSSLPSRSPIHSSAPGPASSKPATSTNAATAASAPLRRRVPRPAGAEWSWPKQWQSGACPRARLTPIAAQNRSSSSEGSERAPPGRRLGQQQHRDGELRQRQRHAHDAGDARGHAERGHGPAAARQVGQLGGARDGEDRREQQPRNEQHGAHRSSPSSRIAPRTVARRAPARSPGPRARSREAKAEVEGYGRSWAMTTRASSSRSASRSSSSRAASTWSSLPSASVLGPRPRLLAVRGQRELVAAAVVRVALALDEAAPLELVDELHHRRAVDAQALADPALRLRAGRAQRAEDAEVPRLDAERARARRRRSGCEWKAAQCRRNGTEREIRGVRSETRGGAVMCFLLDR